MGSYMPSPVAHDLDGLTFPTNRHQAPRVKRENGHNEDFGFDPSLTEQNMFDQYSTNANKVANWNGLGNLNLSRQMPQHVLAKNYDATPRHSLPLPKVPEHDSSVPQTLSNPGIDSLPGGSLSLHTRNLPNTMSTTSLYGQVTPPRSSSATSEPLRIGRDSTTAISEQATTKRRRGKAQTKNPLTPPEEDKLPIQRKPSGRKRTSTAHLSVGNPEDDKRKASLEKNRVAAAKCRVNKKEKTEQLQRDSHTKAQENGQLRGLVETMEAERNTLAAYLSAHASCVDCRNPHQLKEALQMFQENEIRKCFPGLMGEAATENTSPLLSVSDQSIDSDLYDDPDLASTSAMHPPLPDFDLDGDYDMNSPLPS